MTTPKAQQQQQQQQSSTLKLSRTQLVLAVTIGIIAYCCASSLYVANNNNAYDYNSSSIISNIAKLITTTNVPTRTVFDSTKNNLSSSSSSSNDNIVKDDHDNHDDDDDDTDIVDQDDDGLNFNADTLLLENDDDDEDDDDDYEDDDDDGYDGTIGDCPESNTLARWWWTDLDPEERECLTKYKGFTETTWNCYWKDENFIAWKDMPVERQKALELRRYTESEWEKKRREQCAPHGGQDGEVGQDGQRHATTNSNVQLARIEDWDSLTVVRNADMPDMKHVNLDFIAETFTDLRIRTTGSHIAADKFTQIVSLSDYVRTVQTGYLEDIIHLEEGMMEKSIMYDRVGKIAMKSLQRMLSKHPGALQNKAWLKGYDEYLIDSDWDWAMFVGAKDTQSHMHFDSNPLQCLYIAEGRKRVVVMPNDSRTHGKFPVSVTFDGYTVYTQLDMLNNTTGIRELMKPQEGDEGPPVEVVDVILEAGDAIIIPYLAWHAIENLEPTLAFSLRIDY